ncbi:hypothetical protein PY093_17015 [Cytobacillus sp. S13-E01]|uniref:hypothetical protein n=1 Tax=Cytobacillus sp. S13-E01 TaxID=3031326 RepID=UPI0023D81849|nr:hypothetical protein [Cytobacillus sp. S13-E01]MDF0728368.1 hypothetical protein [Cytobacillus sp. S13-E01]
MTQEQLGKITHEELLKEHYELMFDRVQRFEKEREEDWEYIKKQNELLKKVTDAYELSEKNLMDAEQRLKENQQDAGRITGRGNIKYDK